MGCPNLKTLILPTSLERISRGNLAQVEDIYFAGTKAQWEKILIDDTEEALAGTTTHCKDGNILL